MNYNIVEINAIIGVAYTVVLTLVFIVLLIKKGVPPIFKSNTKRKIERLEYDLKEHSEEYFRVRERNSELRAKLNIMDKNRTLSLKEVDKYFE